MNFRHIAAGLTGLGLMIMAAPAFAHPKICDEDDKPTRTRAPDAAEVTAHRHFQLPPIRYDGRMALKAPFDATVLVGEDGRVVCFVPPEPETLGGGELTRERVDVLENLPAWFYTPFLNGDKPASVLVTERIVEIMPTKPVPTPQGALTDTALTLGKGGCFGACPIYQVTVRGDGHVTYEGSHYADLEGRFDYVIAPETAKVLVARMRGRDMWSMRADYSAWIYDAERSWLSLRVGNKTKEIVDYVGEVVGMPQAVTDMEKDIDETSGASDLVHLSRNGVKILDINHFAYTSPQGASLLIRTILDEDASDDIVLAVLDRGAPLFGGQPSMTRFAGVRFDQADEATALNAALGMGRDALVPRLIEAGALLNDGKPLQGRVDSAFRYAITGGRLRMVETLAAYHPALTFMDEPSCCHGDKVSAPVSVLLNKVIVRRDEPNDIFAIARFLIGLGCDINGADADGKTLLMLAADREDADFVRWLLDHGADAKAQDGDGRTALAVTGSENIVMMLLEAGTDPTVGRYWAGSLLAYARKKNWTRVIAWLEAHDYHEPPQAARRAR